MMSRAMFNCLSPLRFSRCLTVFREYAGSGAYPAVVRIRAKEDRRGYRPYAWARQESRGELLDEFLNLCFHAAQVPIRVLDRGRKPAGFLAGDLLVYRIGGALSPAGDHPDLRPGEGRQTPPLSGT